jgi:hypothetical protein
MKGAVMQTLIRIYEHNKQLIETFLLSTLKKQHGQFAEDDSLQNLFHLFASLEAAYGTDEHFIQNTPTYLRHGEDVSGRGEEISALIEHSTPTEDILTTEPYFSLVSGHLVITAVLQSDDGYEFYDFHLHKLLERLSLLPGNRTFGLFSRSVYLVIGAALIMLAIFSVLYGCGYFWWDLFAHDKPFSLETVIKPVIAVTLGLAFFDLGKTIINHEVFQASETLEAFDAKSFVTFLTSIMIALLIEALLSVFKASLSGFSDLLYVSALIVSLALLFYVFNHFIQGVGIWERRAPGRKSVRNDAGESKTPRF